MANPEHVNVLLFDDAGNRRLRSPEAIDYLKGLGWGESRAQLSHLLTRHARHVTRFLAREEVPAIALEGTPIPALEGSIKRLAPDGPIRWLDVQEQAKGLGTEAMRILAARLDMLEDPELIAVAKLGTQVASKQADLEAKGRRLGQMDEALRLAAGMGQ